MGRFILSCAVLLTLGLTLAACGSPRESDVTPASTHQLPNPRVIAPRSDISLDEVYSRMEQAITQPGKVFHARTHFVSAKSTFPTPTPESGKAAPGTPDLSQLGMEGWLDTAAGVGRFEQTYPGSGEHLIVKRGETLRVTDGRSDGVHSLLCRGSASPLLARLMGCGNYLEKSQTTVNSGEYDGREAVVLVSEGVLPDSDARSPFKATLFLDSATWLPVGSEQDLSYGSDHVVYSTAYESGFVDRTSLAADFFEPASIGYVERDPEAALKTKDAGIPIYWLGKSFNGFGGLPELVLTSSGVSGRNPAFPPKYRATLEYTSASAKHGPPLIGFQEFAPPDWEATIAQSHGGNIWDGVLSEMITLAEGHALLFRIPASWNGERYLAQVFLPETVMLVTDFDEPSPYNTRAGFEAVIHGLTRR